VNDHADSSVSDVTSEAGDCDDTARASGGSVDGARETGEAAPAHDHPLDQAKTAEAAAGHPEGSVDASVSRLHQLDSTDVSEHPAIYEDIHRSLASALDDTPSTQADR
jgi:hypothetical protein